MSFWSPNQGSDRPAQAQFQPSRPTRMISSHAWPISTQPTYSFSPLHGSRTHVTTSPSHLQAPMHSRKLSSRHALAPDSPSFLVFSMHPSSSSPSVARTNPGSHVWTAQAYTFNGHTINLCPLETSRSAACVGYCSPVPSLEPTPLPYARQTPLWKLRIAHPSGLRPDVPLAWLSY